MSNGRSVVTPRLVFGLALMAFGTLFFLDEMRIVDFDDILRWWPLIPLAVGLTMIARPTGTGSRVFGALLAVFGVWQLAYDFDLIDVEFWDAWPLLLIAAGAWVVWRALAGDETMFPASSAPPPADARDAPDFASSSAAVSGASGAAAAAPSAASAGAPPAGEVSAADTLSSFAFLGYSEKGSTSPNFQGADVTAILGGCKIDLRAADTDADGAVIDAFAFWGGIKILVGEDWVVTNKVLPLLGGLDDRSRAAPDASKQLLVRGTAIMGGVEVANRDDD
ncbi:MAG: DUF5668 domain-containing protein [Acidobacteriota bacterium]|jgi:hypothetical protein